MDPEIEGTVQDLSRFGEGVVKTQHGVVFAPGALPGERVVLRQLKKQSGTLRAREVRVVDPSGQRIASACSISGTCGGCPMIVATETVSDRFKRALLEQALVGLPGADELTMGWVGTSQRLAYRRRARLGWSQTSRGLRIGYHRPRSNELAEVRTCAVLLPQIDAALGTLHRKARKLLQGKGELHFALGQGAPVVALRSEDAQPTELYELMSTLVTEGRLAGAALRVGGASVDAVFGDPREHSIAPDGQPFEGSVAGFSQAHGEINASLVAAVVRFTEPAGRKILELFSGAGNLTVALAPEVDSLIAVEADPEAAAACRRNLEARGLSATVRTGNADTYQPTEIPDTVVLDPPRSGAKGAVSKIVKVLPERVIYVSCDPPTLRRDLQTLAAKGYRLTDAIGLDMFPQTAHLESVVRLVR